LQRRRAEQRLEGKRDAALTHGPGPTVMTHPDPQIRGRKRERRGGWRGRRPDGAHHHLGAIRSPRRAVALDGESGAAQKKVRRIADGLETGLEVTGKARSRGNGGALRAPNRRRDGG